MRRCVLCGLGGALLLAAGLAGLAMWQLWRFERRLEGR